MQAPQPKYYRISIKLLLGVLLLLGTTSLLGQYTMTTGSVSTCSGTFSDSGGPSGNYGNNENFTYTICPNNPGDFISLDFSYMRIRNSDVLTVYDSNTPTNLIATYTNINSGSSFNLTSTHVSGCLTFVFTSDGSQTRNGWEAAISCITPPVVITNGSTGNHCSGVFTDSGGPTANYGNGENITYSLCPSVAGQAANVSFTSFDIDAAGDLLSVYDGIGTGSLIGTYSNANNPNGQTLTSSDATGCLTFVFTSDGSTTGTGWTADITCSILCLPVAVTLASSSPAVNGAGEVEICQGSNFTLTAAGSYPLSGTNYVQSDATSTFDWDFDDGTTQSGLGLTSVTHSYPDGEGYIVQLTITDINGCVSSNNLDQRVAVSTTPSFSGTAATATSLCLGNSTSITGQATEVTFTQDCAPASVDSLLLPDGVGVSYQTTTTLSCFAPGQTLTNVADIVGICVNIEHTWANDLSVSIECPTGQSVVLDSFGGTGSETFLGEPIDGDDGAPIIGVGWDYCWSPTPTYGTWNAEAGSYVNDTLPSGSYATDGNLVDLVGCELNGTWTLTLTDNLAIDNGFIFSFDMNLGIATAPPWTYTPAFVSEAWAADPTIDNPGGNPITVTPTSAGMIDYFYEVTDDFGCDYDTTITLNVIAPADAGSDATLAICTDDAAVDFIDILGGSPDAGGTWTGPSSLTNGDQGTFDPATMSSGEYTYTVSGTSPCPDEDAKVTVTVNSPPLANAGPATDTSCDDASYTNAATASSYDYLEWTTSGDGSFGDDSIEDAVYTPGAADRATGTVTLTLTAYALSGCDDVSDDIVITIYPDTDGDDICDPFDLDDDNDGIPDLEEVPSDPLADVDGDNVPAYLDDDDGNGAIGNVDGLTESAFDTDGDDVPDHFDLDSDNDGVFDLIEAGHGEGDANEDGVIDGLPATFGSNGLFDGVEDAPDSGVLDQPTADSDGDGIIDSQELDSDNDGCNDVTEAGYDDPDGNGLLGVGN